MKLTFFVFWNLLDHHLVIILNMRIVLDDCMAVVVSRELTIQELSAFVLAHVFLPFFSIGLILFLLLIAVNQLFSRLLLKLIFNIGSHLRERLLL